MRAVYCFHAMKVRHHRFIPHSEGGFLMLFQDWYITSLFLCFESVLELEF